MGQGQAQEPRDTYLKAILVCPPSPKAVPVTLGHREEAPESHKKNYGKSISFSLIMEALSSPHGSPRELLLTIGQRATASKTGEENKREMAAKRLPTAQPPPLAAPVSIMGGGGSSKF